MDNVRFLELMVSRLLRTGVLVLGLHPNEVVPS